MCIPFYSELSSAPVWFFLRGSYQCKHTPEFEYCYTRITVNKEGTFFCPPPLSNLNVVGLMSAYILALLSSVIIESLEMWPYQCKLHAFFSQMLYRAR